MVQTCEASMRSVLLLGAIAAGTSGVSSTARAGTLSSARLSPATTDLAACSAICTQSDASERTPLEFGFRIQPPIARGEKAAMPSPSMAGLGIVAGLLAARRPRRVD